MIAVAEVSFLSVASEWEVETFVIDRVDSLDCMSGAQSQDCMSVPSEALNFESLRGITQKLWPKPAGFGG